MESKHPFRCPVCARGSARFGFCTHTDGPMLAADVCLPTDSPAEPLVYVKGACTRECPRCSGSGLLTEGFQMTIRCISCRGRGSIVASEHPPQLLSVIEDELAEVAREQKTIEKERNHLLNAELRLQLRGLRLHREQSVVRAAVLR